MVGVTETQSWQKAFRIVAQNSRWDLTDDEVERHMATSFHLIMEMLGATDGAARRLDPSGEASLTLAKRLRRDFVRNWRGAEIRLAEVADEHFGLPSYQLTFWESSESRRPWRVKDGGTGGREGAAEPD
jgi:hypothetical protein